VLKPACIGLPELIAKFTGILQASAKIISNLKLAIVRIFLTNTSHHLTPYSVGKH